MDYDAIVAGVLGLTRHNQIHGVFWADKTADVISNYPKHIAQDYNALHAAIDVLEKQGWYFDREDYTWHVYHGSKRNAIKAGYRFGPGLLLEHEAIAKCIAAVISHA